MSHSISLDSNPDSGASQAYRDWLGVTASVACAIHCAAMPFVVGFLPLLGLSFLADPSFHKWMVGICLGLALLAFVPGWRRHRGLTPAIIGLCGLSLISIAAFAGPEDCCPSCVETTAQNDSGVQPVGLTDGLLCEATDGGVSDSNLMLADGESSCAASCCSSGNAEPTRASPVVLAAGDGETSTCAASCCSSGKAEPTAGSSVVLASGDGETSSCAASCCSSGKAEPTAGSPVAVAAGDDAASSCDAACCPTEQAVVQADSSGYIDLMWVLMTPLGGLFLVAGHLCNRFWSGPCTAGCCDTDLRDKLSS